MVFYCCFWKPRGPRNMLHVQMRKHEQLISFQNMLGLLCHEDIGVVVIQGIGGSGKTWAAKAAYQTAITSKIFTEYIWISLSINCRMQQLIHKVASCLSCKIGNGLSVERTKTIIKEHLTTRKFILVIDNAYFTEESILEHLGIPDPQQQNLGSKIIVTTRTRRAEKVMTPDIVITPQPLTYEESHELLCKKIGKDINFRHDLICSCYGIPLIIILLAGLLCDGPSEETSRERITNAYVALGSKVSVFHTLQRLVRLGYDQLPSNNVQHCFLYCLIFPEDESIQKENLIHYWIMDGLLREQQEASGFHEAKNIGKEILDVLIKHGMLYLEDNDHVRMHDVIRETLSEVGKVNGYMMQDDRYFSDPIAKLEQLAISTNRIPLMNTEMESLCGTPRCILLSSLLLGGNYHLKAISEEFFCYMERLGILDLSLTRIEVLPSSISCLTRLRMLLLVGCDNLVEIQYIDSLVQLEVLNASGCTSLQRIASGSFDSMVLLKILDLSATSITFLPSIPASRELYRLDLQGCPVLSSQHSESQFIQIPYGVSKSGVVQSLGLGSIEDMAYWTGMRWLPCGLTFMLSDRFGTKVSLDGDANEDSKTFVYASDTSYFNCLEKDSPLWSNCLRKFQIVISPLVDDQTMETHADEMKTKFHFSEFPLWDRALHRFHVSHEVFSNKWH